MGQNASGAPEPIQLHELPGHHARRWAVAEPLTSILGRESEVAAVVALLDREDVRLVSLTGPGGIGKTRLAREVALRLQGEFAHGACFVPFASVQDPALLPSTVAAALGLQLLSDRPAEALVYEVLQDRHLLLVLDNLEHLVDAAAPLLATLLERCPRVSALATSRMPMHIAGEHRFVVDPLSVPDTGSGNEPGALGESAAVALFVERARAVVPEFALTADNAGAVAEICRRLDGLPLALELAAVQVRILQPKHLLERIEHRLTDLHTDRRDTPDRHQTMRAAISWGYELLDPDARRLYRWLSVFAGGLSLDAAGAVASAAGVESPDLLLTLVEHSFLQRRDQDPDDYRFRMLEMVRQFGLEELRVAGEEVDARNAHAAWVLRIARDAEPRMAGSNQVEWLNRLALEHDNIRSALAWLTERGRIEEALDLTGSLWFFRWIRGYYDEARRQFELLLAHPGGAERTVARAKALIGLGIVASHQGDADRALASFEEAIGILRERDAEWYLSLALACYGTAYCYIGQIDACERHLVESKAIAERLGDAWLRQGAICNLGVIALNRGQWETGRELMEESVRTSQSIGDRWGLALGELNLGYIDMHDGNLDSAETHITTSTGLIAELGDKRDLPGAYCSIAEIMRQRGQLAEAKAMLDDALSVARDIGDQTQIANALTGLAHIAHLQGEHHAAVALMHDAMRSFEASGFRMGALMCLDGIADMALALGDPEHAAWCIGAVDGMVERTGVPRQMSDPREHEARLAAVAAALGESAWQRARAAGRELDEDAVLAREYAWQPPAATRFTTATGGSSAQAESLGLSPREMEVLKLMADGLTNQEIADALFLSHRTATSHTSNILGKLGLTTRTAAVAYAIRNGLA